MKKILFILVLVVNFSFAEEKGGFFDSAINGASSLWDKTKEVAGDAVDTAAQYGEKAVDKAAQYGEKAVDTAGEYGGKAWDTTKEYSNMGKNVVIEQTLINGINAMVDTKHIEVKLFDINDSTDAISIVVFLNGEATDLIIDIREFEWSVSKDKKHIIFEKLEVDINIPWISYLLEDMRNRENGHLVIEYSASVSSLLFSIKPDIDPTYIVSEQDPFNFLTYNYNKQYFNIKMFKVDNYSILGLIKQRGAKGMEDFKFYIHDYDLHTADNKKYIILNKINFKSTNKPWIKSIVDNQDHSVDMDFTWEMYIKLGGKRD